MIARVGDYAIHEELGEGAFGKVRHAVHDFTSNHYAIKIMDKSLIRHHHLTVNVRREIAIMKAFQHPHIVSLHHVLSSKTKLYVVLELVRGPELFELIANTSGGLPERSARRYFQQLIEGVLYCHQRGVSHRDLKPENLLIDEQSGLLKITDFGLSSMKGADTASELLTTQCGTPHYIAPEIISRTVPAYDGRKVDAWACGIILFALLAGYLPFDESDLVCLFDAIRHGQFTFPAWMSSGARDLIWRLLCVDPDTRISLNEVITHPWFAVGFKPSDNSFALHLSPPRTTLTSSSKPRKRKHKRSAHRSRARKRDTPDPLLPLLKLELPDLKLSDPSKAPSVAPSRVSATAAVTAQNEMTKSGRNMSFSTRYTLIRKGIVTYGDISLSQIDENKQYPLGGVEQENVRVVESSTRTSLYSPLATLNPCETKNRSPVSIAPSEILSVEKTPEEAAQTVHVVNSLRKTISLTRSASRWYEHSRNLASPTEEAFLQKSTLISLNRLRNQLKEFGDYMEKGKCQPKTFEKTFMSVSKRREMLRLLDVWESRIIRDAGPLSKNQAGSTGLSGDELQDFQTLLLTWETQLGGEEIIEDVLIPGSELVEDEVPTSDIPDRFIQTRKRMTETDRDKKLQDSRAKVCSGTRRNISTAGGQRPFPNLQTHHPFAQFTTSSNATNAINIPSEAMCDDLNHLWNHVLVANTSKLDEMMERDSDSLSDLPKAIGRNRNADSLENVMSVSPVTEWRCSNDSDTDPTDSTANTFKVERCINRHQIHGFSTNRDTRYANKHEIGSSRVRHHSGERSSRYGNHSVAEKESSTQRQVSTASTGSNVSSKSTSTQACTREQLKTVLDRHCYTSFRSSVGSDEENVSPAMRSCSKRGKRSDLGKQRPSSPNFTSRAATTEHISEQRKSRDMSNRSLDDVEHRLVRSFGQRRIQTDVTPDLVPLEVLDTPSGFSAFKKRIYCQGRRQACRGNVGDGVLTSGATDGKLLFSESRYNSRASNGLLTRLFGGARYDARFESAYSARTCINELNNTMKERGFSVAQKPGESRLRVAVAGSDGRFVTVSFDFATKGSGCIVRFRKIGGEKYASKHLQENLVWSFYDEVLEAFRRSNEGVAVVDRQVG